MKPAILVIFQKKWQSSNNLTISARITMPNSQEVPFCLPLTIEKEKKKYTKPSLGAILKATHTRRNQPLLPLSTPYFILHLIIKQNQLYLGAKTENQTWSKNEGKQHAKGKQQKRSRAGIKGTSIARRKRNRVSDLHSPARSGLLSKLAGKARRNTKLLPPFSPELQSRPLTRSSLHSAEEGGKGVPYRIRWRKIWGHGVALHGCGGSPLAHPSCLRAPSMASAVYIIDFDWSQHRLN